MDVPACLLLVDVPACLILVDVPACLILVEVSACLLLVDVPARLLLACRIDVLLHALILSSCSCRILTGQHAGTVYELGWREVHGTGDSYTLCSCGGDGIILEQATAGELYALRICDRKFPLLLVAIFVL